MINIKIICIGKMKEKSMKEVLDEYIKKLSKFTRLDIIELTDEKIPDNAKTAEISKIKEIESKKVLNTIDKIGKTYVFACDLNGKQLNSIEFADTIESSLLLNSTLTFVIGGSLGLSDTLKQKANKLISFSKLTFPHQLFRVILAEQIYRAFKIINNETYHK